MLRVPTNSLRRQGVFADFASSLRLHRLTTLQRARRSFVVAAVAVSAAIASVPAAAAPGELDPGFGSGGKVVTDLGYSAAFAVAVQANGKILVGGRAGSPDTDFALARYLPDGTPDPVLGGDGNVTTDLGSFDDVVLGLAIQADGKILAAGRTGDEFAVVRYRRDGGLDSTFGGGDGIVTIDFGGADLATGLAVQPNGKIVVCGISEADLFESDFAVARLDAGGSLDTGFGGDGTVVTDFAGLDAAAGVALQADGKIVVAGGKDIRFANTDFALARYEPDGSLDSTFDGDGKVTTDFAGGWEDASDVVVQPNGKIVAAGTTSTGGNDFALARYNPNGSLDDSVVDWTLETTFDGDGKVTTDFGGQSASQQATGIALQANGKIVVAGHSLGFALARYLTDGSLDPSFGTGGWTTTDFGGIAIAQDVAVQADGAIVVVGTAVDSSDFALARYLGDPTTPPGGTVPGAIP